MQIITGTLTNVQYIDTSKWGNNRYSCDIGDYTVQSAPNSSLAFYMQNFEGCEVVAVVKLLRGKLVFESLKKAEVDPEKEAHKSYIRGQFEKIVKPNSGHIAGTLQIKGSNGGQTNCLNISAKQMQAICDILCKVPNFNE